MDKLVVSSLQDLTLRQHFYLDNIVRFSIDKYRERWDRIDTILLFIHHLVPFLLYTYSFIMTLRSVAQSKSATQQQTFLSSFWMQIQKCQKQLICPTLMIVSSLPQLIIAFVVDCDQWYIMWFRYLILTIDLISHIPRCSLIFSIHLSINGIQKCFPANGNW